MNEYKYNSPIFIVGVPRSGTTLLAAMLAAHSRMSCGPETRFFHFLSKAEPNILLESWPINAIKFLFSMTLVTSVPDHFELTEDQLRKYLFNRPPSVSTILSSITEQFMINQGKSRWVEKSPEHLKYVDVIRRLFPTSPIIRIVRDPRDAALSMIKTSWGPQVFLEALLSWRKYDDQSADFFQNDVNCYTLSYEALIQSPEKELRKLCVFVGESYESGMLDTWKSGASLIAEQETHKALVYRPVDKMRLYVWKRELTTKQKRMAESLIGDRLITYGYDYSEEFECLAIVYPLLDTMVNHESTLVSFVDNRVRFWGEAKDNEPKIIIYVGDPDSDQWLSNNKPKRWLDTLRIISRIIKGKFANQPIYWLRDKSVITSQGYCSRALGFILKSTCDPLPG